MKIELLKFFKRRRLLPGNCLNHVPYVLYEEADGVEVCMGPLASPLLPCPMLHCWLEFEDTVIDLTANPKFCSRNGYYRVHGVDAANVKRFTRNDVAGKLMTGCPIEFWEFDVTKYLTKPHFG